jgi:hypothetical protein
MLKHDRFQVVGQHEAGNFLFDSDFFGIHRSDDPVMIQITWNEGRTVEHKMALYKPIADGLAVKHAAILDAAFERCRSYGSANQLRT